MAKITSEDLENFRSRDFSFRKKGLKSGGPNFLVFLFALLVLVSIVALAGFFYFTRTNLTEDKNDVDFGFYSNPQQIIGQENTFLIFVKNKESRTLENAEVVLNFPAGFNLNSSVPGCNKTLTQGCVWFFPQIKKGEVTQIELKGYFLNNLSEQQAFDGALNYRLEGYTSEFQKNFFSIPDLESPFHLTWDFLQELSLAEIFKSSLILENITEATITQADLSISLPPGFVLTSADPETKVDQDKLKWSINNILPHEKRSISFEGFLNNNEGTEATFKTEVGLSKGNIFFPQIVEEKTATVKKFGLNVSLNIDNDAQIVDWGQVLPLNLVYENGQETVTDLTLQLKISNAQYIDEAQLKNLFWQWYTPSTSQEFTLSSKLWSLSSESLTPEGGSEFVMTWDRNLIPAFQEIAAGSSGKITLNLPITSVADAAKENIKQAEFNLQVFGRGKSSVIANEWSINSLKKYLKIKTNLDLLSRARYYDDEGVPIGTGPIPPKNGRETRYWIFFDLKNTANPVDNVVVKTKLPLGVNWTGQSKASQGLLLYNNASREVSWQISALDTYQGGSYSLLEAGFEISLTPDESQIGSIVALTEDINSEAVDRFTGVNISQKFSPLDTNLIGDPQVENKGQVE